MTSPSSHEKLESPLDVSSSDGVLQYSARTRVQLEYHFLSTRTRNTRYSYSKVNVLGTRAKTAPSTRVHLAFAGSNKQDEFSIANLLAKVYSQ